MDKDLVIGYTKNAERMIKTQQISMAISYLCLLYFYEYDYFIEAGKGMQINKRGDTIKIQSPNDESITACTCYSALDIPKNNKSILFIYPSMLKCQS